MTELDRWVHELSDALSLDREVVIDIGVILDLARVAAHQVDRPAAPLTTFLVGYAAGRASRGENPVSVDVLAARATALADSWPSAT